MSAKSKFSAVVILAVVFTIGGLFGVGGTVAYLKQTRGNRVDRSARTERSPRDIYRAQVDREPSASCPSRSHQIRGCDARGSRINASAFPCFGGGAIPCDRESLERGADSSLPRRSEKASKPRQGHSRVEKRRR